MAVHIIIENENKFRLLYSSKSFEDGLTITGYLIYPDITKSDVFTFEGLGDGIYTVELPHERKTSKYQEKYGLVVKENGVVTRFEIVHIIH